jgi:large subunit ribosomal protein L30e
MVDLNKALANATKKDKVLFGTKKTLKIAMSGKCDFIVVASNCPKNILERVVYYCNLSDISWLVFPETSRELGKICKKPFLVSILAIRDSETSKILKMAVKKDV